MKKKTVAIVGVCILLSAMMAVIIILVLKLEQTGDVEDTNSVYVIDENNYTQIADEMDKKVSEGYFETYMNTSWTFADGTSETKDAVLGNSPNNTKPIRCEVTLKDTGETVFRSGVLPVGAQLPAFKLDTDLDAGVYEALCTIFLLQETEEGTYTDFSNAGFNITIIVQD